jgi:hypothetical protein
VGGDTLACGAEGGETHFRRLDSEQKLLETLVLHILQYNPPHGAPPPPLQALKTMQRRLQMSSLLAVGDCDDEQNTFYTFYDSNAGFVVSDCR